MKNKQEKPNVEESSEEYSARYAFPPSLLKILLYFINYDYLEEMIVNFAKYISDDIPVEFIEYIEDLCAECNDIIEEALDCSNCTDDPVK